MTHSSEKRYPGPDLVAANDEAQVRTAALHGGDRTVAVGLFSFHMVGRPPAARQHGRNVNTAAAVETSSAAVLFGRAGLLQ
jgi:hypothetical protein